MNLPTTKEEAEQTAHTLITNHRLFGLEIDGKLVSVAAKTRPTKNNITVNFVYTPKEERKKGYASNCVAALSQRMLDEGYKQRHYIRTWQIQHRIKFTKKLVMNKLRSLCLYFREVEQKGVLK